MILTREKYSAAGGVDKFAGGVSVGRGVSVGLGVFVGWGVSVKTEVLVAEGGWGVAVGVSLGKD